MSGSCRSPLPTAALNEWVRVVHDVRATLRQSCVRPGRRRDADRRATGRSACDAPSRSAAPNASSDAVNRPMTGRTRSLPGIDKSQGTRRRDQSRPLRRCVVIDVRPRETPRQRTDPAWSRHHRAPHRRASSLCARSRTHAPSGSWVRQVRAVGLTAGRRRSQQRHQPAPSGRDGDALNPPRQPVPSTPCLVLAFRDAGLSGSLGRIGACADNAAIGAFRSLPQNQTDAD
jgi:hypothetical protein